MMSLSQAAQMTNGTVVGADVLFGAVSKDTRTISQGSLYVALKGENFDGHAFVQQAGEAGAIAALVSDEQALALPQITVDDTKIALGDLAAGWRKQFNGLVIGITGSSGKTTVKEMCRCILEKKYDANSVMSTLGNLNNDIGLPMTLLTLADEHQCAVIEMGANHMGEIAYLTNITQPDVAVITNAAAAHIEGFGSIDNVAEAKSEIYDGLSTQGVAVINQDDKYSELWKEKNCNKKIVTFSLSSSDADVSARNISGNQFLLKTSQGEAQVSLNVLGRHNIANALAAVAATMEVGLDIDAVVSALESYTGMKGRLQLFKTQTGAVVIDDTYNANPYSLNAAIDVAVAEHGSAWLVLGDMGELGDDAVSIHFEAGVSAKKRGIKRLFAIGSHSRNAVVGFGEGAIFFEDKKELATAVYNAMDKDIIVLVKGSRYMRMEDVVEMLMSDSMESTTVHN